MACFQIRKKWSKSLSFAVRVYSNLQLSFFTQFREKLFCMQTTKAQIIQGGGGRIASRGRFVPLFLLGNKWQLMIFQGGGPDPLPPMSPPISEFQTVWIHILFIFFAGPGQFTKRLLIISADPKGKDSMILFKIKETAYINSGHVLF